MPKAKANCLVRKINEWEWEEDLEPGGLLGLNHYINKVVDKDVQKVCIMMAAQPFDKDVKEFSKCAYTEHGEDIYASSQGDILIPIGWILQEVLPAHQVIPDKFYLKIIEI